MIHNNDAFGLALADYLKHHYRQGGEHLHFTERDDNYIEASQTSAYFNFNHFNKWFDVEKKLFDWITYGRTLDIGCGAGRHSLYLQQKELPVCGIDQSPLAIEVCKRLGLEDYQVCSIEDLRDWDKKSWDHILMLGHNLGLLGDPVKAILLLEILYQITATNGHILATCRDPYQHSSTEANPYHLAYIRKNQEAGLMGGQIKIRVRYRNLVGPWFNYLFMSPKELEQIIRNTGWKIKELITSGNTSTYGVVLEK